MPPIAPDGIIIDVNEEATRLTGYSRKHLVNSRFSEYFTESARARAGVQQTVAERRVITGRVTDAEGRFDVAVAPGSRVVLAIDMKSPGPLAMQRFVAESGKDIDLGDLKPPAGGPRFGTPPGDGPPPGEGPPGEGPEIVEE